MMRTMKSYFILTIEDYSLLLFSSQRPNGNGPLFDLVMSDKSSFDVGILRHKLLDGVSRRDEDEGGSRRRTERYQSFYAQHKRKSVNSPPPAALRRPLSFKSFSRAR